MPGPRYDWPPPSDFVEWRMADGAKYEGLRDHVARVACYEMPTRIWVPRHDVAIKMVHDFPLSWLSRRPYGITHFEKALCWTWNCYTRRHDPEPIFLWDWRTISYQRGIAEWTEDVAEIAVLAEVRIRCKACERPKALPLTNRVAPFSSSLCMPCQAIAQAANCLLRDEKATELEKLVEATQMITRGTSNIHRWTRCPESWDKEDWYGGRQRQFKRDVASVAVLVGIAGTGEIDLHGHVEERLVRIADHLRGERDNTPQARRVSRAPQRGRDAY